MKLVSVLTFILVILLTSQYSFAQRQTTSVTTRVGNPPASTDNFVFYCQADPRWNNSCGIDSAGCGPTSMAMIVSSQGLSMTPVEMDQIFRENGARACGGVSVIPNLLSGKWFKDNFIAIPLVSRGSLDMQQAKNHLDANYLILGSSASFPCPKAGWCRNPGAPINHIFVVNNVDSTTNRISARDSINCSNANPTERIENIWINNNFSWLYAYAIKRR